MRTKPDTILIDARNHGAKVPKNALQSLAHCGWFR